MVVKNSPIYVFVPGAWHTPDTFDGIRALLSKRGYDSEAIALPSVGAAKPAKSGLHADIAHTNIVLRELAEQGRQIVVVTHSYGGMVGSGAVEGLGYAQRSNAGQAGGVIMVVWLAAFVTPKGKSVIDMLGGNWLPWMLLSVCVSTIHLSGLLKRQTNIDMKFRSLTITTRTPMMATAALPSKKQSSIMT